MNVALNFSVEKHAMSRTIRDYTTDNFISSYAEQLNACNYPDDKTIILILMDKLHEWYESGIDRIKKGEYIHSKESHYRTFELIKYYQEVMSK